MKINIPTKITIARIILIVGLLLGLLVLDFIPGYVPTMLGNTGISLPYLIAFVVFVIAALTDYIDGHLARKWNQVTTIGKFLDPIADKLLVDSMLIYLCLPHFNADTLTIPLFCVIVMIGRDLVIDAFRQIAAAKGKVLAANIYGKLKTVFQMVAIPVVILNGWPFSYFDISWSPYLRIGTILIYLATLMSLLSAIIYLYQNRNVLKEEEHA